MERCNIIQLMLKKYVEKIKNVYSSEDAREESFYSTVETLSSDEIQHYCRIVTVIGETINRESIAL